MKITVKKVNILSVILFTFECILVAIIFILSQCAPSPAADNRCRITRVIDGDTLAIEEKFHGLPLFIRLNSIDTPEKGKKAQCPSEAKHGERATSFTKKVIENGKVIRCNFIKHDKYGGRILADVYIDGVSLADKLIEAGLARPYHGEKKQSWCK